jgi:dephospho-CoA kinase
MTRKPRRIALTGGIASGKSLVGDYLIQKGIPVIDADLVVHQLLREDEALKTKIRAEFGPEVFTQEGEVDRPKLGQLVFADTVRRKLLESWIHPKTREFIEQFYIQNAHAAVAVSIIPLLFESQLENHYDEVWLLQTDEETQLARLTDKRGMPREDALARIHNQMPFSEKLTRAQAHPCHVLFLNNADSERLYREIDQQLSSISS